MLVRRVLWASAVVLLCGCTASHYRRSADKEVYNIIQQAEQRVFGHTNAFSIDTRYSARTPKEILPPELIEDRFQTNQRILSLKEALELAVQNSREYQAQKEQLYLTALSLTGARYQFTPIFLANSSADLAGTGSDRMDGGVSSRIGVSQLFKTGGRLSVTLANDLLRYFVGKPAGATRNTAIDTLSVNLSQPLLQGFGWNDPTVENLTQAERNTVYAVRTFSQNQKQFDMNIVLDYLSLLSQKSTVRNNYTNYVRRAWLFEYTEARAVDRDSAANVDNARTAELAARIQYVNSVANYFTQLDAFKLRLGIPVSETLYLKDAELAELEQVGLIPVPLDSAAAYKTAVAKNLDILSAIDRFEDSKRKLRIARDQLRPAVGLFANANVSSDPPDDYANFDPSNIRYQVGVQVDDLVDKLPARNAYRQSLIAFESQLRSLVASLDNLRDRIERGFRALEQRRQNFINQRAAFETTARRVEMTQILFEAGRRTVQELREAQDDLISAQNSLTESTVSYLDARLQLLYDIGVLSTSEDKFWLKDPISGQTATIRSDVPLSELPQVELKTPNEVLEPMP